MLIHIHLKSFQGQCGSLAAKVLTLGPGTVAQVVKVLALHARDPIWPPVLSRQPHFPSSSLPVARESSRGWPKTLGPCTHMGDLVEAPGFWLQTGTAPALVAAWGVNHCIEDLPFYLSSFLYI